jgi:hypothetical protein
MSVRRVVAVAVVCVGIEASLSAGASEQPAPLNVVRRGAFELRTYYVGRGLAHDAEVWCEIDLADPFTHDSTTSTVDDAECQGTGELIRLGMGTLIRHPA